MNPTILAYVLGIILFIFIGAFFYFLVLLFKKMGDTYHFKRIRHDSDCDIHSDNDNKSHTHVYVEPSVFNAINNAKKSMKGKKNG